LSTWPVAFSPCACWNVDSAAVVFGPILPSTVSWAPLAFSAVCSFSIRWLWDMECIPAAWVCAAGADMVAFGLAVAGVSVDGAGAAGAAAAGGADWAGEAGAWATAGAASRTVAMAR